MTFKLRDRVHYFVDGMWCYGTVAHVDQTHRMVAVVPDGMPRHPSSIVRRPFDELVLVVGQTPVDDFAARMRAKRTAS